MKDLAKKIQDQFPDAKVKLDPAETPTGCWYIDIAYLDGRITVEWNPKAKRYALHLGEYHTWTEEIKEMYDYVAFTLNLLKRRSPPDEPTEEESE